MEAVPARADSPASRWLRAARRGLASASDAALEITVAALVLCLVGCTGASSSANTDEPDPLNATPSHSQRADALLWGNEQRLEASDAAEFDQLGYSVAVAAELALLGAYGEEGYRGAAYVFKREGDTWYEVQKLDRSESMEGDDFGWSVALSEDRALFGSFGNEGSRGAAYVFARNDGAFAFEQKLTATDAVQGNNFGWSVALSEGRALVGAHGHESGTGAAYVFAQQQGIWTQEQRLTAPEGAVSDLFGYSVALGTDLALLGAPAKDDARGAAYVFVRDGTTWTMQQRLSAEDGEGNDHFGVSVALFADRALVGAYWDDGFRGAAYVFERRDGTWLQEQKLVASDGEAGARLGGAVALNADRALVGAYGASAARGAAYMFRRDERGWAQEEKLSASDAADNDSLGWSVALGDGHALVGAHYDDNLRGAVYAYSLAPTLGSPCTLDEDCSSGHCVDQRCCDVACDSLCQSCSIASGATIDGICTSITAASPTRPGCGPSSCDASLGVCASARLDAAVSTSACDGPCSKGDSDEERAGNGCACQATTSSERPLCWLAALSLMALGMRRTRGTRGRIASNARNATLLRLAMRCSLAAWLCALFASCSADSPSSPKIEATPLDAGEPRADGGQPAKTPDGTVNCGQSTLTPKRIVRLTHHQLFNAYGTLFGASALEEIAAGEERPQVAEREFPPIAAELEISENLFAQSDRLAQAAGKYVTEHAEALTECGPTPGDGACVKRYLLSFAQQAFRHPLSVAERDAIAGQFWDEMLDAGATPSDALGYGVYGILSSPSFLYRTEFGEDVSKDGALLPYELATSLSLFLTDQPPDAELLAAAADHRLRTADQVRQQVARLLASDAARRNLESVLFGYFSLNDVDGVIVNADSVPGLEVTRGLLSSIRHEGELFLSHHLWAASLDELLTSRRTWTTARVATEIYGVEAPEDVDPDGFGRVDLPADRAGLLTLSTFLTAGARSTGSSPVRRGLAVNASIVCAVNPPFPGVIDPNTGETIADSSVSAAMSALADGSELERARYRAATPACAACHSQFDAFGLVLEPYDALGRFRSSDAQGRPIDADWTTVVLPDSVGGAKVTSAAEAAQQLVESGALDRCMAASFIDYALTEVSRGTSGDGSRASSCAVQGVLDAFMNTDRSFSSLLQAIAVSDAFTLRSKGRQ